MLTTKTIDKYLYLLVAVFAFTMAGAQKPNFIHIQSENNQPYYVQWKDAAYQSSTTGYLVIPQVATGDHEFVIGFLREEGSGYVFTCTVTDKARGFTLKQGIDNSLSLFDMVSFTVMRGTVVTKEQLQQARVKARESVTPKAPDENQAKSSSGSMVVNKEQPATETRVKKIFDKASPGGIDQVYIVFNGSKMDTVALFIPILEEPAPKKSAALQRSSPNSQGLAFDGQPAIALLPKTTLQNTTSK